MKCKDVPGWDTKKCCVSCHEDSNMGYPTSWIILNGEIVEVCCQCALFYEETGKHNDNATT